MQIIPDNARCLSCDYSLQGLPTPRCPECGKPFDPADPQSFHQGQALSRANRFLLSPTGYLYSIPAAIILALLCYISGIPRPLPKGDLVDSYFYFNYPFYHTRADFAALDPSAKLFLALLFAVILLFVFWLFRWFGRLVISTIFRRRQYFHFRLLPQLLFGLLMAGIALVLLYGWPNRIAQTWTTQALNKQQPRFGDMNLLSEQKSTVFRACIIAPRNPRNRLAGINLVSEWEQSQLLHTLRDAVLIERDPTVLTSELHILGLARAEPDATLLDRFLTHPNPDIRAAAADALGIWHNPEYAASHTGGVGVRKLLETTPPVDVSWAPAFFGGVYQLPFRLLPARRQALLQMMLQGPSLQEREAAARALLPWPPDRYRLRIAEWGVFAAQAGKIDMARSILDENPPFVHRLSDPLSTLTARAARNSGLVIVYKPVIHITAREPMAVDLEVRINNGRPWVAYPAIDDYVLWPQFLQNRRLQGGPSPLVALDLTPPRDTPDLREGYPWLLPHHHSISPNPLTSIGVHWQSLIVSPQHLPWMAELPVPPDPRFQWWNQLRKVDSSWLSSRGESERFLYYDGPTLNPSPIQVTLDGSRLAFRRTIPLLHATALFISNRHGQPTAACIPSIDNSVDLNTLLPIPKPAVALQGLLTDRGLTDSEAQGLIAAWSSRFFDAPGQRLLLFLPREYYDQLCPLAVRPEPSQLVRVGILLFEFNSN